MIKDAGFTIKSEKNIDDLIEASENAKYGYNSSYKNSIIMKNKNDLRKQK